MVSSISNSIYRCIEKKLINTSLGLSVVKYFFRIPCSISIIVNIIYIFLLFKGLYCMYVYIKDTKRFQKSKSFLRGFAKGACLGDGLLSFK